MGKKKESFIFVLAPIKGVFWHFKVERPRSLSYTVSLTGIWNENLAQLWTGLAVSHQFRFVYLMKLQICMLMVDLMIFI